MDGYKPINFDSYYSKSSEKEQTDLATTKQTELAV
jgi:hypothetical protein